jgi:proline iminopeptidase
LPRPFSAWHAGSQTLIACALRFPSIQEALHRHEQAGTTDAEEYNATTQVFNRHYLCRLDPFQEVLGRSLAGAGWQVYQTMWGPNEFYVTGTLKDYDRTTRVAEITVPTLLTCGRYDEVTPDTTAWYQTILPRAEVVVFEQSAHLPHLEETESYVQVVRNFLRRAEQR